MTDSTANGLEPKAGQKSECSDSDTVAHKNGFLPLLSDVLQQSPVSTNESNISTAPRTVNEKRLDSKGGHVKGHTFLPLLPVGGTDSPKRGVPGSSSPTPSAGALNAKGPLQEHREHVAEAAAQENNGDGPLPSCRIEESRSPNEPPRQYGWPLIVLHRARSAEDGDQQPGQNCKEANEDAAKREEKVAGFKTDDKSTDESAAADGGSANR